MYPRLVTEKIIELQAKGFSAEETRSYFAQEQSLKIGINTIYRHRKSVVGQEIADEMVRAQQRSIRRQEEKNPGLAMKYRNELLKLLLPQRIEQKIETPNSQPNVNVDVKVDNKIDVSKEVDEIIKFSREEDAGK